MVEINFDGVNYPVYASEDTAEAYAAVAMHAVAWPTATEDDKVRALITSARILDRQRWKPEYDTYAERLAVTNIVNASIELAIGLLDGAEVQSEQNTSQKIASMSAGPVSISYFPGAWGAQLRFPLIVHELLRDYLLGQLGTTIGRPRVYGVCGESVTRRSFTLGRNSW